jgi:hypothetical protein
VTAWDVDVAGVGDVVTTTAGEMTTLVSAGDGFADASSALAGVVSGTVASTLTSVLDERTGTVGRISVYADLVVDSLRTAVSSYVTADIAMADTVTRESESSEPGPDAAYSFGPGPDVWGAL